MSKAPSGASPIASALIAWHARNGRHDLPWQARPTPYRVWVSEIMLQQTQVAVVIPYYERFVQRFPDVLALAEMLDDVLHAWAGLGYYARARNLHRAARDVRDAHGGEFPRNFAAVAGLAGIGRSTAGAILALACDARHPILDGNARRVLARYFGIEGHAADARVAALLWARAESCTPAEGVAVYTQAIMDLGATLCTRRGPRCLACPLEQNCVARREGRQHHIPAPRRGGARPMRHTFMLAAIRGDGALRLERRPPQGIWGGLWCLPEFRDREAACSFVQRSLGGIEGESTVLAPLRHAFTHFELSITPVVARCTGAAHGNEAVAEGDTLWYQPKTPQSVGLPAPIRALVEQLADAGRSE